MPGKPRPAEIAKLRPGHKHNPQRRKTVPKSEKPLPSAPRHLSTGAKKNWREICKNVPESVLTGADAWIMEICCELMAEYRENPRGFQVSKMAQLQRAMGSLGLTPADRVRLGVKGGGEEKNEFDAF